MISKILKDHRHLETIKTSKLDHKWLGSQVYKAAKLHSCHLLNPQSTAKAVNQDWVNKVLELE